MCLPSLISGGRLDGMNPVCNVTVVSRVCNDACMSAFKTAPRVSPNRDCRKASLALQMCQGSCCAAQRARRFLTPDTFVSLCLSEMLCAVPLCISRTQSCNFFRRRALERVPQASTSSINVFGFEPFEPSRRTRRPTAEDRAAQKPRLQIGRKLSWSELFDVADDKDRAVFNQKNSRQAVCAKHCRLRPPSLRRRLSSSAGLLLHFTRSIVQSPSSTGVESSDRA